MPPALENVEDIYPLSSLQEGMLYHSIEGSSSTVFVTQVVLRILSDFETQKLLAAWRTVVSRHAALRTIFVWDGVEKPLQIVRKQIDLPFTEISLPPDERSVFDDWLVQDRETSFALDKAPPWRLALLKAPNGAARLVWTCHHLLCDGWSAQTLLDEIADAYDGAIGPETPAPSQLRQYIAWRESRESNQDEQFWRHSLAGFLAPQLLSTPGFLPSQRESGHADFTMRLDEALTTRLKEFAANAGVTLNTVVSAAWALFLSRSQLTDDIVFGVTVSTRPATIDGVEEIVGPLINTLPLRLKVDADLTAADFARYVQKAQLAIREFDHVSLAKIQRWSEAAAGSSLFESIFVFENLPSRADGRETGLKLSEPTFHEHSNFPLAVLAIPGERIALKFVYDRSRFGDGGVQEIANAYAGLLSSFGANLEQALDAIPARIETAPEPLERFAPATEPQFDSQTTLDLFDGMVSYSPNSRAVSFAGTPLTYRELDEASSRIARLLAVRGVRQGDIVGLCAERSGDLIAGLLGVLKCGAAYAPLDPAYPRGYIDDIIDKAGIRLIVVSAGTAEKFADRLTLNIDEAGDAAMSGVAPDHPQPDDLAYVIHTSGSSGAPKGVMISHANLAHSTLARNAYYGAGPEKFLLLSSVSFDSSVAGIYWSLTTGGELVLAKDGAERDVDQILSIIERERVTHLLCLPSLYRALLDDDAARRKLRSLRVAIVAGEACDADLPTLHRAVAPQAELHNEYGPTEATVWCTAARLDDRPSDVSALGGVSIGRQIPGVTVCIRDQHGHLTPKGLAGEITVSGPTLAEGYLEQPALTAEKFLPTPGRALRYYRTGDLGFIRPDGEIGFLGRIDNQLKIRGRRIEAEHIAAALKRHDGVSDAVVTVAETANAGVKRLAAYVTPIDGAHLDEFTLKSFVGERLPAYMTPDVIIVLEALPHLPNGKVDLRKLPTPEVRNEVAYEAPLPGAETIIAEIWSTLLGIERISRRDDFFELGGDSLLAMRLVARIRKSFGKSMPVSSLAETSTVAGLARLLDEEVQPRRWRALVPLRAEGAPGAIACVCAPFSAAIFYKPIADRLEDLRAIIAFEPVGQEGEAPPLTSIEEMAELYVAELLEAYPRGPYALIGYCIGATVCHEMAHRLQNAGHKVEILIAVGAVAPFRDTVISSLARKTKIALVDGGVGTLFERTAKFIGERAARKALAAGGEGANAQRPWGEAAAEAFRRAFEDYNVREGQTPILAILASKSISIIGQEPQLAWRAFTNEFDSVIIEGKQETVMAPPEVEGVARLVNEALARRSTPPTDDRKTVLSDSA